MGGAKIIRWQRGTVLVDEKSRRILRYRTRRIDAPVGRNVCWCIEGVFGLHLQPVHILKAPYEHAGLVSASTWHARPKEALPKSGSHHLPLLRLIQWPISPQLQSQTA